MIERVPYFEIERIIIEMNFRGHDSTLKKNVAAACFALAQSPFEQRVHFYKSLDNSVVNLQYTCRSGNTAYKRIMSIPYWIAVYNEICDKLGLE